MSNPRRSDMRASTATMSGFAIALTAMILSVLPAHAWVVLNGTSFDGIREDGAPLDSRVINGGEWQGTSFEARATKGAAARTAVRGSEGERAP
jgi:hypothetical protein